MEDQLLPVQHVVMRARCLKTPLLLLKLDVAAAYDWVDCARLWPLLLDQYGIAPDLVAALRTLYVDLTATVKLGAAALLCFPYGVVYARVAHVAPSCLALFTTGLLPVCGTSWGHGSMRGYHVGAGGGGGAVAVRR